MSEVCSAIKERIGWLTFRHVVNGPSFPRTDLSLRPYTETGDTIKIVPDPEHNPSEYFLLEYRKSTGREPWRPDGALAEEELPILHINERLGVAGTWLLRDAPYFDPEFADYSDNGAALWTGHDRLAGILYPRPGKNAFTRWTAPSSNFYGERPSGLSITDISVGGDQVTPAWRRWLSPYRLDRKRPRPLPCRPFHAGVATEGQELFCRNDDAAALLVHRQAQWFVASRQDDWIGDWNLGGDNYEVVGDFDGDGQDEVYLRSPEWATVMKWDRGGFLALRLHNDWIVGEWNRR